MIWLAKEDIFSFNANAPEDSCRLTQQYFLSTTAALFDPMGFLAPFEIRAKVLLQDMSGIDWNDELTQEHAMKAPRWFNDLDQLSDIKIPLCIQMEQEKDKSITHICRCVE